jgi:hypothetical protein
MESHWTEDSFGPFINGISASQQEIERTQDWFNDSFDPFMNKVPESQLDAMDIDLINENPMNFIIEKDLQAGPPDIFYILDFSKLFKLGPVSTKVNTKFNVARYVWEVNIASLPCSFSNETSLRLMPHIFEEISTVCTEDFDPNDRILIELDCRDLVYPIIFPLVASKIIKLKNYLINCCSKILKRNSELMIHLL